MLCIFVVVVDDVVDVVVDVVVVVVVVVVAVVLVVVVVDVVLVVVVLVVVDEVELVDCVEGDTLDSEVIVEGLIVVFVWQNSCLR